MSRQARAPGQGEFTLHRRLGNHVVKTLRVRDPVAAGVEAALRSDPSHMCHYLTALQRAGVRLPEDLAVVSAEPLAVRHRWVDGPVLLDRAGADPARFVSAVVEIAGWVRSLAGTDARVDANLANFCLTEDDEVVLVDVLPPLIPTARPEPRNLFDTLFTALCFDTVGIGQALIGYAARALLPPNGSHATTDHHRHGERLAHCAGSIALTPGRATFPESWFQARLTLALKALAGHTPPRHAHELFTMTSVRRFRDLSETGRTQRIQQVEQVIKECDLT